MVHCFACVAFRDHSEQRVSLLKTTFTIKDVIILTVNKSVIIHLIYVLYCIYCIYICSILCFMYIFIYTITCYSIHVYMFYPFLSLSCYLFPSHLCLYFICLCIWFMSFSIALWAQVNLLPVQSRGGAGQHLGDRAGVFWGAAGLLDHQGGVQASAKPRGRVSVCPLQDPDRRAVTHHTLTSVSHVTPPAHLDTVSCGQTSCASSLC